MRADSTVDMMGFGTVYLTAVGKAVKMVAWLAHRMADVLVV